MILGLLRKRKPKVRIKDKTFTLKPWSIEAIEWASEEFAEEKQSWRENLTKLMEKEVPSAYMKIFYYLIENKEDFENYNEFFNWIKEEPTAVFNKLFIAVAEEMLDAQPELKDLKDLPKVKKKMILIGILIGMSLSYLICWLPDIIFLLKSFMGLH